jgi:hypothetical protein
MRSLYSKFLLLVTAIFLSVTSFAQISVTATVGTTGPSPYTTLKGAFDAINAGTHKGVVTISITGNTTETATAVLNASSGTSSYTAVNIGTTATPYTITTTAATLIQLNGASNVTLNGSNTLQLVNTSGTGNVLQFINDASGNTFRNVTIKGGTNAVTAGAPTNGIIFFSTGLVTGNDNNLIDNVDIDGTSAAACGIYSKGTKTTDILENSGNTVNNCKIHDYINAAATASMGMYLEEGNAGWTITNNNLYHTGTVTLANQFVARGLVIFPSFTNDAHTITGNFVGGNATGAAGTMTLNAVAAGTNALGFIGLDVQTGGPGNLVQNNTVRNVAVTYSSTVGSFSNAGIFAFIGGYNGTTTISGNTINNLTYTNTSGFISFQAIHVNGRVTTATAVTPTFTITNNNINNITCNSGGAVGDIAIHGIRLETSSGASLAIGSLANPTFTVTGNNINTLSAPFAGVAATYIRGIGSINVQGGAGATLSTASLFPKVDISGNTLHTFTTGSTLVTSANNYAAGVLVGINFAGSTGANNTTDVQKISQNTIYNFSATATTDAGNTVIGILATTGVHDVSRNQIYDLRNAASGATNIPGIVGIRMGSSLASSTVSNNFVSLGTNVTAPIQIFGILNNFTATGPMNFYYNTVVVTGTATGAKSTAAFLRGTETFATTISTPVNLKNNIFYNTRTGGTGVNYAIANTYTTVPIGWVSDYNNLYSTTAANVALWGATPNTLATYKTNSGDVNSKSVTVNFTNVSTGDLHLTGSSFNDLNLVGTPITGITIDYDGNTRSTSSPFMGADEGSSCVGPVITTQPLTQAACAGSSVTFTVAATGAVSYQWRKNGVNIAGATSATYTINPVAAADAGSYDVVINGAACNSTSTAAVLTVNAGSTWTGTTSTDWNVATNWCGGVPTATSDITIASGTTNSPIITGTSNNVRNLTIGAGATLTIPTGTRLNVYGNLANSGTLTATAGTLAFQGTSAQTSTAFNVGTLVLNGAGGVTLSGNATAGTLTLTSGNLTLGTNTLTLTSSATGSTASHVITNSTGSVVSNAIGAAAVVVPVGPDAASYDPVTITNGGNLNYTVRVIVGHTPAILNSAKAINRTWTVTPSAVPGSGVTIGIQYADAEAGSTAAPAGVQEVGIHNGTIWTIGSGASGITPTGSAAARVVSFTTTQFGPMIVGSPGSFTYPTAIASVDSDVSSIVLMPSIVNNKANLRVVVLRSMNMQWLIVDASGRVVLTKAASCLKVKTTWNCNLRNCQQVFTS